MKFKSIYVLSLILTMLVCFYIYINFQYVIKMRKLEELNLRQEELLDANQRLLSIIYVLEDEKRVREIAENYLNLEKKKEEEIYILEGKK